MLRAAFASVLLTLLLYHKRGKMSRGFGIFFFVKLHKILREKCCNVGYYAQNRAAAAAFRAATRKQAGEGFPPVY